MQRMLVISPHPDDEAIGCGGTLSRYASEGASIKVIFLTSGEQGGHGAPPGEMLAIREREAVRAAKVLGIQETEFWREPDGGLRASNRLVEALAVEMNAFKPTTVLIPYTKDHHADHRAAARLARRAARVGGIQGRLLMYEVWTPLDDMDVVVDITGSISMKLKAIKAYRSQCSVLSFDEAMLGLARYRGELFDWPRTQDGVKHYAEVFKILRP